ncbi:MAG: hypothetical protein NC397_07615 [Clostridium sp.]|nr:hypothetical protein [Clostridium sp.]
MKKLLAVLMAVVIVMAFAGCSSKQYEDTEVTVPVTDENGEAVTDKNGAAVTEVSKETEDDDKSEDNAASEKQSSSSNNSNGNKADSSAKEKTSAKKSGTSSAAKPKTTEKKETTTAKPVKRNVDLTVVVPYFNQAKDTKITVKYRTDGKKYEELVSEDITLGSEQTKKYKIKKIKGDIDVIVTIDGVDVTYNTLKIMSYENNGTIKLVTGIEMLDGGWD